MEWEYMKIPSKTNNQVLLRAIRGHFATSNSHVNYYLDMTTVKTRQSEAKAVAKSMKMEYVTNTIVDTIVCMDGCEVIGAYLAEELSEAGFMCRNAHKSIYVVTPEFNLNGQMIFRENLAPEIRGRHVLLILASASTGETIKRSIECIQYYGGIIQGISAIFSSISEVEGFKVDSIFNSNDLPDYQKHDPHDCPYCKDGIRLQAIVSGYGYTKL